MALDVKVMPEMLSWGLVDKIWYYLLNSFFFFLPQVSVKIYEFSLQNIMRKVLKKFNMKEKMEDLEILGKHIIVTLPVSPFIPK